MDDTVPAPAARSWLASVFVGRDGLRAGWSLLLFSILVAAAIVAMVFGLRTFAPETLQTDAGMTPRSTIVQEALSLLAVGIPAFIMAFLERRRFARYNVGAPHRLAAFAKGLVAGLVMLSILIALLAVTGSIRFSGEAIGGGAIVTYGVEWLVAFILVGLFEEFAFRGYLQFTLARGVAGLAAWLGAKRHAAAIGFWVAAIVFSVVLFAYVHTGNGGETAMGITAVSLAGLTFVFSLWWTGSLWWAIGFHAAWDWAQSYLYGVADSGLVSQGHLLATAPTGNPLLSGGATGPEGSVLVIPVLLASMLVVWKTMPRRLPPVLDGEA
jgi:membrane protease YdiL (CAAX protease family)